VTSEILVHGHRGARAVRPENTLPAFEYAIAAGADALEMDVLVTRDDIVVVVHDPLFNPAIHRTEGRTGAIRQLTMAELGCWDAGAIRNPRFPKQVLAPGVRIPALEQVLALAERGDFLFNIELKSFPRRPELTPPPERFAELVWDAIRSHRLEHRVIVQSFDFRVLNALRRLAPSVRQAALYMGRPRRFVAIAREARTEMVAPFHALVSRGYVSSAQAAGLEVVAWTANRPMDWKRLILAQVNGIITDNPGALVAYLEERGLRKVSGWGARTTSITDDCGTSRDSSET
jgi:glycerophosphoryl diester phosphodiesterase